MTDDKSKQESQFNLDAIKESILQGRCVVDIHVNLDPLFEFRCKSAI
jgi:hypothetical protein